MTHVLAYVVLASALFVGNDEAPVAERIVDQGMSESQVMDHLDALVNGIGPRLTGSAKLNQA